MLIWWKKKEGIHQIYHNVAQLKDIERFTNKATKKLKKQLVYRTVVAKWKAIKNILGSIIRNLMENIR